MKSFQRFVFFFTIFMVLKWVQATPTSRSIDIMNSSSSCQLFAGDLFTAMVEDKSFQNIVYSPVSIQTCLALAFIGAEGDTAIEMRQVLYLGKDDDKIQIAEKFSNFLKANFEITNLAEEVPTLKMANRLYVNDQLKVSEEFNKIALEYFETQAELINFTDSKTAVGNVNKWVAQQTDNKIVDILTPDAVNRDTNLVLINAIYFKAKWLNPFSQSTTSVGTFYVGVNNTQEADMMYNEEYYGYAELPELSAAVLEMPYNNSDISMLIILPNETDGLASLESKLKNKDLMDIMEKIQIRKVHAHVPKFRIEFDIDLKEPLEKMGLITTFSSNANFKSLFTTPESQSISEVKHKAFLDVNEAGSEAAAASFATLTTLSGIFDEPIFRADHSFVFAILSKSAVYFAGHVATV